MTCTYTKNQRTTPRSNAEKFEKLTGRAGAGKRGRRNGGKEWGEVREGLEERLRAEETQHEAQEQVWLADIEAPAANT